MAFLKFYSIGSRKTTERLEFHGIITAIIPYAYGSEMQYKLRLMSPTMSNIIRRYGNSIISSVTLGRIENAFGEAEWEMPQGQRGFYGALLHPPPEIIQAWLNSTANITENVEYLGSPSTCEPFLDEAEALLLAERKEFMAESYRKQYYEIVQELRDTQDKVFERQKKMVSSIADSIHTLEKAKHIERPPKDAKESIGKVPSWATIGGEEAERELEEASGTNIIAEASGLKKRFERTP